MFILTKDQPLYYFYKKQFLIARILLILVLYSKLPTLLAQPYIPLISEDKTWFYSYVEDYETSFKSLSVFVLRFNGDTLINQVKYNKLRQYGIETKLVWVGTKQEIVPVVPYKIIGPGSLYALMREDTLNKKVYLLPLLNKEFLCSDSEILLYNFNLKKGDNLNDCLSTIMIPNNGEVFVDSLSYNYAINFHTNTQLTNDKRKLTHFNGFFPIPGLKYEISQILIEGFGLDWYGVVPHTWQGNPLIVFGGFCKDTDGACLLLNTKEGSNEEFTIFPNPVINRLHFNFTSPIDIVDIYSLAGHWEFSKRFDNNNEIDVSSLPPGIYQAIILQKNGARKAHRFIKI